MEVKRVSDAIKPCPFCGATHSEWPSEERAIEALGGLVKAYYEIEVKHDTITSFEKSEMGGSFPVEHHDDADCRQCLLLAALITATKALHRSPERSPTGLVNDTPSEALTAEKDLNL